MPLTLIELALLLRRAFAKACLPNPLKVVSDGQEAIWYLSGKGRYADRAEYPLPELVLLDIKMPHKNGLEVLKWIREQPSLRELRVVMLTASDQARDVDRAYQLGANSFVVKPADSENLVQLSAAGPGVTTVELLATGWMVSFNESGPPIGHSDACRKSR